MGSAEIEHGYLNLTTGTNPAAGAGLVIRAAIGSRFRLFGLRFRYTASIAAATRQISYSITSIASTAMTYICTTPQIASQVYYYNLICGFSAIDFLAVDNVMVPLEARVDLNYFNYIYVTAVNIQAADQIDDISFYRMEWIED